MKEMMSVFLSTERGVGWALAVILVAGLVVRVGWGQTQGVDSEAIERLPDQREYLELGRNLLAGEGLKFVDRRFGEEVVAFRMPGYPVFVAMCGGSIRVVRLVQAVVDTLSVLGVFVLARGWLSAKGSVVAAALVAVNPYLIYFSGLLLTETLFTAMLVWGMVLMAAGGRKWGWVMGGLVLAGAVMVRPSGIMLGPMLGAAGVWVNRQRGGAYQAHRPSLAALGCLLLAITVMAPWAVRNWVVLEGRWVWTTTNAGFTRYDGFNPQATGASDQRFVERMSELQLMDEVDRSRYLAGEADAYIRTHPWRVMELAVVKAARTWSPIPLSAEYGSRGVYVAVGLVYSVPLYLLIVLGVTRGGSGRRVRLFLLVPAVYFTIIHALSVGSLRYRIPVEPPLCVIAASWLMQPTGTKGATAARERLG